MRFSIPTAEGSPATITKFIDISQCASIVNRRFYRQGKDWAVAGFTLATDPNNLGKVTIAKIPQNWPSSNAWHKTYAAWKKQQDSAVDEAGLESTVARYRDFKIHANVAHATAAFSTNSIPVDATGVEFQKGEWQHSEIVIPNEGGVPGNTQQYLLHMVGPDANPPGSKGMIENYADSRSVPQSPDPAIQDPEDSFFSEMIDLGQIQDAVVDQATDYNDDLPYSQDNYPGGALNAPTLELVHETALTATVNSTSRKLSGTNVPCGLLSITSTVPSAIDFWIHLIPGPDRGYLTQPMQDM